ncbi:hypothetical protein P3W85_29875 [Cupriavidus basilensis]|uniref:DUF559 domain-containing protein n=1 Tax=Cupriavidus basilensis TaxID=68895 RepID=A0ABT6AY09_9BURK|nr:hypothetical protein [Cupriavidus basilensis]MDF3837132.1 hypothetical protein [Cupriavidus basilensis]
MADQLGTRGNQGVPGRGGKEARGGSGRKAPAGRQGNVGSAGEEVFALHVKAAGLIAPEREYRFDAVRKWRFDFAWPARRLAVEVEGGTWSGGRHTRGAGYKADLEKYNAAATQGWTVLRFTTGQVKTGEALAVVLAAMGIQTEEVK